MNNGIIKYKQKQMLRKTLIDFTFPINQSFTGKLMNEKDKLEYIGYNDTLDKFVIYIRKKSLEYVKFEVTKKCLIFSRYDMETPNKNLYITEEYVCLIEPLGTSVPDERLYNILTKFKQETNLIKTYESTNKRI